MPTRIIVTNHRSVRLVGMEDEHAELTDTGANWRNPISGKTEHLPAASFRIGGPRR